MNDRNLPIDIVDMNAGVLDHASDFVALVHQEALAEYQRLLGLQRFVAELASSGTFNHGKLYVYAEFSVFRREFRERFPEASPTACINAFSGLFLKNDISIHNLVEFVEGSDDREQLRLNSPDI